ncbi:MAG: ATP-binding protein [Eggerthellaceae bacterium]|nr:ATP-binding protein [Eggerthellaceae bacterium]
MLRRKMFDYLQNWKRSHGQECLLVNGARQVGKSFIVSAFGRSSYENYLEIDFLKHPEYRGIFEGSLSADDIFSRITLYMPGVHIVPGKTLLFLDEIQECPAARASFKYLAQDGRCDVVGSGSLLGIRFRQLDDAPSLPVGYERQVTMRPLDFEEFLWALGYDGSALDVLLGLFGEREPVPQGANEAMMRHVREYLAVGGMPSVVNAFAPTKDYSSAHDAQVALHTLYLDDIARYATPSERVKARACYESLPRQLAKENTKFQYAVVEKHGSARKFDGSVDWLAGSEMVRRCQAVSAPDFPLASYEDSSRFRLYANDTGLLMAMFDFSMKAAVVENTLAGSMKGGIYENLVACMLAAQEAPLRYWMSKSGNREIEFLVDRDASVVPIDVKASRGSSVSLDEMLEKPRVKIGYKLIDGNVGQIGKKVTLPIYMAMFLMQ